MIKWIVCDMDGTLLNENNQITEKTKAYLIECQKKGLRLILASGRSYARLKEYYEMLEMPQNGGMLIEVNGLYINDLQKQQRIQFQQMTREDAIQFYELTKKYEPELMAYIDQGIYYYIPESMISLKLQEMKERQLPDDYPLTGGSWSWVEDMRKGYPQQVRIYDANDFPEKFNKLNIVNVPTITEQFSNELKEILNNEYEFVRSTPRQLEITRKNITKGNALKNLMEKEGITMDEVLVFGDGENDYSMFDTVKYSIAMGNAPDYVKQHAYDVTDSNNHDGIYKACLKYIGK